jgi:hypothetical protein
VLARNLPSLFCWRTVTVLPIRGVNGLRSESATGSTLYFGRQFGFIRVSLGCQHPLQMICHPNSRAENFHPWLVFCCRAVVLRSPSDYFYWESDISRYFIPFLGRGYHSRASNPRRFRCMDDSFGSASVSEDVGRLQH